MHLTRLLFILLLSAGLWSSVAAKTALPEVIFSENPVSLLQLEANQQLLQKDCIDYALGYADGVCEEREAGCDDNAYFTEFQRGFASCVKGNTKN